MTTYQRIARGRLNLFQAIALPTKESVLLETQRMLLMLAGILLGTLSYVLFQVPFKFSWGGAGGLALIIHHFTGMSHGMAYYMLAAPMVVLGFFFLGRWKFVSKSIIVALLYGASIDVALAILPAQFETWPITANPLLGAVFGGIVGGVSGGLIYRSGTSFPGSSVISLILNKKMGLPLSSCYLLVDGGIILGMGLIFGIESSLYGLFMLIVGGFATDYALEGPSTTRTISVVTNRPKEISAAFRQQLGKGASYWEITGGTTRQKHYMVVTTIFRSQMADVKATIADVDPAAFVTVGISHQAMGQGQGFAPLKK